MLVSPRELDKAEVRSLFAESVVALARDPKSFREVEPRLKDLSDRQPDDLPLRTAAALAALAEGDEAKTVSALADLEAAVAKNPLETLPPGAAANSRQRAEAARQIPLWLVARLSWARASSIEAGKKELAARLKEASDRLASRAIDAAARQSDNRWTLAMLREQGQIAMQRGNRAEAEAAWGKMLDSVLRPEGRRTSAAAGSGLTPPAMNVPPAPAPPVPPSRIIRKTAYQPPAPADTPPAPAAATTTQARPLAGAARRGAGVPVLTVDRFEQSMQVAKLAAKNGLHALSLRAVRESLKGGPPVTAVSANASRTVIVRSGVSNEPADPIAPRVVDQLVELDSLWLSQKAPAPEVYEVLRDVVMPEARPNEVFPYAPTITNISLSTRPKSVGHLLAGWAVRADKVNDLRARIDSLKEESPERSSGRSPPRPAGACGQRRRRRGGCPPVPHRACETRFAEDDRRAGLSRRSSGA